MVSFHPTKYHKCNWDDTARGAPGLAGSGAIFRDSSGATILCFSAFIGVQSALYAEIFVAMLAIEIAASRNWRSIWLGCDSHLVINAFNNPNIVPWRLRRR